MAERYHRRGPYPSDLTAVWSGIGCLRVPLEESDQIFDTLPANVRFPAENVVAPRVHATATENGNRSGIPKACLRQNYLECVGFCLGPNLRCHTLFHLPIAQQSRWVRNEVFWQT